VSHESDSIQKVHRVIEISDIQMITEDVIIFDNSKQISLSVGAFAWIGVGLYSYGNSGDVIDLFAAAISGVIWGGIAWIIAKLLKKTDEIIRIITKKDELIELPCEPVLSNYFSNLNSEMRLQNYNDTNPTKQESSDSNIDKYDQLLRLKELYDKDILTKEEFDIEKARILSRGNQQHKD